MIKALIRKRTKVWGWVPGSKHWCIWVFGAVPIMLVHHTLDHRDQGIHKSVAGKCYKVDCEGCVFETINTASMPHAFCCGSSIVKSCPNLLHQASLSFTVSQSLLKSYPLSWWWHLTISFSVATFSSCSQSSPASGSFPVLSAMAIFHSCDSLSLSSPPQSERWIRNARYRTSLVVQWLRLCFQHRGYRFDPYSGN